MTDTEQVDPAGRARRSWMDMARDVFPNSRPMTPEERRIHRRVIRELFGLTVRADTEGEDG